MAFMQRLADERTRGRRWITRTGDSEEGGAMSGNPITTRGIIMEQGDIVVERLTGKHVMLLEHVNDEWICRFGDGRQENRRAFELAPSPFARVVELIAQAAGALSNVFGQLQKRLAVSPPQLLQIVQRQRRHGAG